LTSRRDHPAEWTTDHNRKPFEINRLGLARSFQITNIFHRLSVFENLRCAVLWSLGHRYAFWKNLNKLKDAEGRAKSCCIAWAQAPA